MSDSVGGISRTVNYKGNRIDIGGHRFFSKSDRVMEWWLQRMPLQKLASDATTVYRGESRRLERTLRPDPDTTDRVMLLRRRKSRIYFLRKFFDYPLRLNADTVAKLGFMRMVKIALSYARVPLFAIRNPEKSGGVLHQPIRPRTVPHVLQVVHGKGLGRKLFPDQRGVGRSEDQGAIDRQSRSTTS